MHTHDAGLSRRGFLGAISLPAPAIALAGHAPLAVPTRHARSLLNELAAHAGAFTPDDLARDEDFWTQIARAYTIDRSIVNLNNGGVSPSSAYVQDAMKRALDETNRMPPPYELWQVAPKKREAIRERLAREWDVDAEELAITRNASEGLQALQFGIDLKPGDEVLTTYHDYPRMLNTFRQRGRREGIVLRQFDIPTPCEDDDEIVRRFADNITDRTRMILISHMVFLTGQVLPVAKVGALGRERGIPVIVDGAHAFAHVPFTLGELGCDYYATSLHKWLGAPHGTGLLYVNRDKIEGVWSLMASDQTQASDIRKFEEIGTHPAANFLAIAEALTMHQAIGDERKLARLVYLRDRWAHRLAGMDRVTLRTSLKPGFAGGIATVDIEGVEPGAVASHLWNEHRIFAVAIKDVSDENVRRSGVVGLRVSPNVYTTLEEIDRFADAMERIIKRGLPA
ncbi:MAG: aminotransferase class V-fold PLP-dependent enzyme [Phycisphaerales bacterium]|jgi:selenocysteine lyase/cysteine desulfurase|nr:aminotransferase class V-fold PLP-dependent enzyme [Phycisphaerales bacterium]